MPFRTLGPDDFAAYRTLRLRALREHPGSYTAEADVWARAPRETLERHLADSAGGTQPILGGWQGDEPVALLGISRSERASVRHKGTLWGLYVAPEARGRGVGRGLVEHAVAVARELGPVQQLRAVVMATDAPALRLLERCGFGRFGTEPRARLHDGALVDQVYLWRPLDDP